MSAVFTPIGEQVKQDLQDTGPPLKDRGFRWMLFAALSVGIITLAALLIFVFLEGYPRLTPTLWQNMPSIRFPEKAGAQSAIMGSIWVIVTTAFICLPIGVMAAIYLEEYGNPNRKFDRIVEINIQNLAAVPSIVYGILGLGVIARALALGQTVIIGGLLDAVGLVSGHLVVIISSWKSIRAVPSIVAGLFIYTLALGATQWQTIWNAGPAVTILMIPVILALSREIGKIGPTICCWVRSRSSPSTPTD